MHEPIDADRDGFGEMDGRMRGILAVALLSLIVGGTADLVMDRPQRWLSFHVVYEKAGLGGRAELAVFFLHDLMLPEQERESPVLDAAVGS